MKYLKYGMLFLLTAIIMSSCTKDDNKNDNVNEVENLQLVKSFSEEGYTLELFNSGGKFIVGYNKIYLRLTDSDGNYVKDASFDWMPMMTMDMGGMIHEHSCPFSDIKKVADKQTLYEGYIVFIMESHEPGDSWNLEINFTVDGHSLSANGDVSVVSTENQYNKSYTSVIGEDDAKYFLALVEPQKPIIGTNDIVVALFKAGEHHDFPRVDNYTIKIDPRMPGMGNHSAPGNEDMTQGEDGLYYGKVGFSMSGYWLINLILENDSGTVVRGEPVTEENPESSLNFKLEF